jgi:hypothetical protein
MSEDIGPRGNPAMSWDASALAVEDNVAVLLHPVRAGAEVSVIAPQGATVHVTALEPIALCHKIALADIAAGEAVLKYGECIGIATAPILRGEWVHTHNLRSRRAQPATTDA